MSAKQRLPGWLRRWTSGERIENATSFKEVLAGELEDIDRSRRRRCQPSLASGENDPVKRARASRLTGLALSGGGIRSATFCLGVIQALASADLLSQFDYLSTVSGGGYIGGWLTAWIKRSRRGVLKVQRALRQATAGKNAPPIDFIRDYSNYLAPRSGFFSADTWTIGSVWLRNTVLNQSVIILFFSACLLIPRLLGLTLPWVARFPLPQWVPYREYAPAIPGAAAALLLLWAVLRIAQNLLWFEAPKDPKARNDAQPTVIRIGIALLAACWLAAAAVWQGRINPVTPWIIGIIILIGVFAVGRASGFQICFTNTAGRARARLWPLALLLIAIGSAFAGIALTFVAGFAFDWWAKQGPAAGWHFAVWGAPCLLFLMVSVAVVQMGLMGRWMPDDRREWWSRLGAWMFILITGSIALSCISIYGPLWTAQIFEAFPKFSKGITLGWIVTTLVGVRAGQSDKSGGQISAAKPASNKIAEWIARITPYVAIPGILLAISTLLNLVLAAELCNGIVSKPYPAAGMIVTTNKLDLKGELPASDLTIRMSIPVEGVITENPAPPPRLEGNIHSVCEYRDGFFPGWRFLRDQHWNLIGPLPYTSASPSWKGMTGYWEAAGLSLVLISAATWLLAWRIDVNEFSLHHFYKNRLVRCYLGASNPNREHKANPFTGFSLKDDVLLATLRPEAEGGKSSRETYVGPYLIVNGALNFTRGERLAWQERKAASFVFTPRYCGFDGALVQTPTEANAYRRTDAYAYPQEGGIGGIHLGTSMAISGAAASPNMGYHTSGSTAFLLTLFNVRLGWWLGNPRHPYKWKRSGPLVGLLYLLNELFGSATAASDYVYISDGGHFENLGVYELVRRRCQLIVACDSEEDHHFTFGGLGNAIRKCRDDLGVDIELDLRPLQDRDEHGRTSTHVLIGQIDYHDGREPGMLLYLKSSLTKPALHEEPADVLEYSMRTDAFPHQTTGDQFFDESQFESYRRLGQHIGEAAIDSLREARVI